MSSQMASDHRVVRIMIAVLMLPCWGGCWWMSFVCFRDSLIEYSSTALAVEISYCILFMILSFLPLIFGGAALMAEDIFDAD